MRRFAVGLVVALCLLATPGRAAVWYVGGRAQPEVRDGASWATALDSIQEALDKSAPGDEVWVAGGKSGGLVMATPNVGLYGGFDGTEARREDRLLLRKPNLGVNEVGKPVLWVQSTATGAVVDGFDISGSHRQPGVRLNAPDARLQRCDIHDCDASGWVGGGIMCTGPNAVLADNRVFENRALAAGGIYVSADGVLVARNDVRDNTADNLGDRTSQSGKGGGMVLFGKDLDVRDNVVAWNTLIRYGNASGHPIPAMGGGLFCGGTATFVNNTLAHNTAIGTEGARGGGLYLGAGTFHLANNVSYRNAARGVEGGEPGEGGGISYETTGQSAATVTFQANYFYDDTPDAGFPEGTDTRYEYFPQFVSERDFHLTKGSPLIDFGALSETGVEDRDVDGGPRVMGQRVDIGAYELPVSSVAPLQARTFVRPDGDDRRDGYSWETARRSVGSAISVTRPGGEVWVAAGTYRERITLTPGMALYGGFAGTETRPSERDIRAHETVLDAEGRGRVVTIPKEAVGARLDGFTIRRGTDMAFEGAGGGVLSAADNAVLAANTIERNLIYGAGEVWPLAIGGGACVSGNGAIVAGNVIRDNRAESYGYEGGLGSGAEAHGGGLAVISAFALVLNNLIVNNTTLIGGQIFHGSALGGGFYPVMDGGAIANNTIAGNSGFSGDIGLPGEGPPDYATPAVVNNIVAFNAGSLLTGFHLPNYLHNVVYGNTLGLPDVPLEPGGNIAADPLFADRAAGDYHLQPLSPAIDAGSNNALLTAMDLDGHPRIQSAAVDIGAYEWTPGGSLTVADAAAALRIAAGLSAATPDLLKRLNVDDPATPRVNMRDVVRLLGAAVR